MSWNDRYTTNGQPTWQGEINRANDHAARGWTPEPQGSKPADLHNHYVNTYNQAKGNSSSGK